MTKDELVVCGLSLSDNCCMKQYELLDGIIINALLLESNDRDCAGQIVLPSCVSISLTAPHQQNQFDIPHSAVSNK